MVKKLSKLFFETQKLTAPRYLLLKDTKLSNLRNYLLGFSDGSVAYSTSCIYLVSCDASSNRVHTSLINTMSRLSEDTLIAKTEESIPAKEMHGLLLCASNMVQTIEMFQECKIPIHWCHIGVDALSQVVALLSPPHRYKLRLRKYYSNINLHLYEIAIKTNQLKENVIFWMNQFDRFNPADLLGKFDLEKDSVSKWMEKLRQVLRPD